MHIRRVVDDFCVSAGLSLRAYWWRRPGVANFGDELNPYLLARLSGKRIIHEDAKGPQLYVAAIGSILHLTNENAIVWGAGIIEVGTSVKRPHEIRAVRGPRTAETLRKLGYQCPEVYGDPALLLPLVFPMTNIEPTHEIGIIPHFVDYRHVCDLAPEDTLVIDLLRPIEEIIQQICSCKRIVSSSLHGIIVSHAYGRPAIRAKFSDRIYGDGVKFDDYSFSVNLPAMVPFDFTSHLPSLECLVAYVDDKSELPKIDVRGLLDSAPFKLNINHLHLASAARIGIQDNVAARQ